MAPANTIRRVNDSAGSSTGTYTYLLTRWQY